MSPRRNNRNSKTGVRTAGRYAPVLIHNYQAESFVPFALPPDEPPIDFDSDLQNLLSRANHAVGKLDGIALSAGQPNIDLLVYAFTRKEAVLSSQIEGTQSSLSELLLFEHSYAPGVPLDDVRETSNYLSAINHGLQSIRENRLPLSVRLLREMHALLLQSTRGAEKAPGELRRSAVWIGGASPADARFIPPPWQDVPDLLADLERFIHDQPTSSDPLVKAAMAHVQFETIHPFLDGNGRLGRLLIALMLCADGLLEEPLLYLSLYFKQHRRRYYEALDRVRTGGDWEGWLRFFLAGVIEVSENTVRTTTRLVETLRSDRDRALELSRSTAITGQVFEFIAHRIVATPKELAEDLRVSPSSVSGALSRLEKAGIVGEVTGRKRNRVFVYGNYMAILNEDTEPLQA